MGIFGTRLHTLITTILFIALCSCATPRPSEDTYYDDYFDYYEAGYYEPTDPYYNVEDDWFYDYYDADFEQLDYQYDDDLYQDELDYEYQPLENEYDWEVEKGIL